MIIDGFSKLTLLDYPDHLACIIFTRGCNWNCEYCQNSSLINYKKEPGIISKEEVLTYLKKRQGILEGIVISGGEPTIQKDLVEFIKDIKKLNYKVKLDTNGTNPDILENLITNNLVDYVAMDIKNDFKNYQKIINCPYKEENIKKSINILKNSNIAYEFRTTVIKNIHQEENILNILKFIGNSPYYIQNFRKSDNVRNDLLEGFENNKLLGMVSKLKKIYPNIKVRGIIDNNIKKDEEVNYYV